MLYFSKRPVELAQVKIEQLSKLEAFKEKAQKSGLQGTYKTSEELSKTMATDLTRRVRMMKEAAKLAAAAPPKVPDQEAVHREFNRHLEQATKRRDAMVSKLREGKLRRVDGAVKAFLAIYPIDDLPVNIEKSHE